MILKAAAGAAMFAIILGSGASSAAAQPAGTKAYQGKQTYKSMASDSDDKACISAIARAGTRHMISVSDHRKNSQIKMDACSCELKKSTWGEYKWCTISYTAHLDARRYEAALAMDAREKEKPLQGGSSR